jgi:hypothetical protein
VNTLNGFAFDIALGDKGRALLVGEPTEDTEASKPGNPQSGHDGTDSGASWVY